jgi:hypothetical protein
MSRYKQLTDLSDYQIVEYCKKYRSAAEVLREEYGVSGKPNGRYTKVLNQKREALGLEWFKLGQIEKVCPVCGTKFTTPKSKPSTTCSHGCANTYFRSGENNGMYKKGNNYRTICFIHHKKECIVCGENKIVAVHHYDENHNNNDPANLVPLCPTHHQYIHSKYANEIKDIVDNYVKTRHSVV